MTIKQMLHPGPGVLNMLVRACVEHPDHPKSSEDLQRLFQSSHVGVGEGTLDHCSGHGSTLKASPRPLAQAWTPTETVVVLTEAAPAV
jgi:hypothetical protein